MGLNINIYLHLTNIKILSKYGTFVINYIYHAKIDNASNSSLFDILKSATGSYECVQTILQYVGHIR